MNFRALEKSSENTSLLRVSCYSGETWLKSCYGLSNRVPKCDVIKNKFVKLWDLVPFSSKTSLEKGPCQKLPLNCNSQPEYKGWKFDTAPYNAPINAKPAGGGGAWGGILTFSKRLLSNSLPPVKNARSNITKFPTPRNDLWSRARTKIPISLPPGQQENSNALPPGQSDRSKSRPMPLLRPRRLDIDRCIMPYTFISTTKMTVLFRNGSVHEW